MQSTGIILWFHPPKYLYCISSGPSTYLWRKILHLTYGITPDTAQSSSKMLKSFVMTVDNIHIYIYVRLLVDDVLEVRGLKGHECFCLGTDPPSPILLLISPLPHHWFSSPSQKTNVPLPSPINHVGKRESEFSSSPPYCLTSAALRVEVPPSLSAAVVGQAAATLTRLGVQHPPSPRTRGAVWPRGGWRETAFRH